MPSCLHMIWIVLYGSISVHFLSVAADCYFPSGLLNELYQPCDRSNEHSMCCGTRELDRCRKDGLCFDAPNNDIWRGSCTDPTWNSPACIKLCVEGTGTLLIMVDVLIRRRQIQSRAPICQHVFQTSMAIREARTANELRSVGMEASVVERDPTPRIAATVARAFLSSMALSLRQILLGAPQEAERASRHHGRRPHLCLYHQSPQYRIAIPPMEYPHLLHPQAQHHPSPRGQITSFPSSRVS